jgi:Sec-independent protein translocase protein TatA
LCLCLLIRGPRQAAGNSGEEEEEEEEEQEEQQEQQEEQEEEWGGLQASACTPVNYSAAAPYL